MGSTFSTAEQQYNEARIDQEIATFSRGIGQSIENHIANKTKEKIGDLTRFYEQKLLLLENELKITKSECQRLQSSGPKRNEIEGLRRQLASLQQQLKNKDEVLNQCLSENIRLQEEKDNEIKKSQEFVKSAKKQLDEEKRIYSEKEVKKLKAGETNQISHSDIAFEFEAFFKNNRAKVNYMNNNDRTVLNFVFQECYDTCRLYVVNHMRRLLIENMTCPPGIQNKEKAEDISRAYALLLFYLKQNSTEETVITIIEKHVKEKIETKKYQLEDRTIQKAAKISWNMVCTVPPCICSQPDTLDDEFVQKTTWDEDNPDNKVNYLQPVLFFEANDSNVGAKGRITNACPTPDPTPVPVPNPDLDPDPEGDL